MLLEAEQVTVEGAHGLMLAPTSLRVAGGSVALVTGRPGPSHAALALALGGRIRLDHGTVRVDGRADPRKLRRRVALIDTPGVSEPDGALPLSTVVGEDLAMAGRPAGPRAVARWLADRGAAEHARSRVEQVPAGLRLTLMLELACLRPGVGALVLTAPDRHGGPVEHWWALARQHAETGRAVVVTAGEPSARLLGIAPVRIGGETATTGDPTSSKESA